MLKTLTISSVFVWVSGDLGAQWFRFRSGKQEVNKQGTRAPRRLDLNASQLLYNGMFGLLTVPLLGGYWKVVIPRVFGQLPGNITASLAALAAHQLVVTPTILIGYFNCMTGARGGLRDPSFMHNHFTDGASTRHTVLSIQSYMMEDVMPFPLLCSWLCVAPCYALAYSRSVSALPRIALALATASWCGVVSHAQNSLLL